MPKTEKYCKKCDQNLPIQEFSRNVKNKDGLNNWCKECYKIYFADYYKKNTEKHRAIAYEVNRKKKSYLQELVNSIKGEYGCQNCDEDDPDCLDFHHLDPSKKEFTISEQIRKKVNPDKLLAEISKCIVICANCHRKLHMGKIKLEELACVDCSFLNEDNEDYRDCSSLNSL